MGLVINTNVPSINSQRNLGIQNLAMQKSMERLSSGLRINRAADDSAGLAIANKLLTQVRGYRQGISNASDAINLIQTAEGGLEETQTILQRMRELALQASNDTLTNNDRQKIQLEIYQLREELTSIATKTNFNTKKLLDGSVQTSTPERTSFATLVQNIRVGNADAGATYMRDFITAGSLYTMSLRAPVDISFQLKIVAFDETTSYLEIRSSRDGVILGLGGITLTGAGAVNADRTISLTIPGVAAPLATFRIEAQAGDVSMADIGKIAMINFTGYRPPVTIDNSLVFQIGANQGEYIRMGIADVRAQAMRLETVSVLGTNEEHSKLKAQELLAVVDDALEYVARARANLGAYQNRLESSIRSMEIAHENLSASESRIRDTDFSKEAAEFTRRQILVQSATSMLMQANVLPQNALSLLR